MLVTVYIVPPRCLVLINCDRRVRPIRKWTVKLIFVVFLLYTNQLLLQALPEQTKWTQGVLLGEQRVSSWDGGIGRHSFILSTPVTLLQIVDGNPIKCERITKVKKTNQKNVQIEPVYKFKKKCKCLFLEMTASKGVREPCKKNKIHFVYFCFFSKKWNKTGINKWKCFNRVHSFTLAGKHQMHWQKCCFLNGFCLHKEPDVMIIRVQVVCSVSQKTWLASSSVSDEGLDFRLTSGL